MTPQEAIEAAAIVEAETRYRIQLAAEAYQAGRRDAEAAMDRRWNQIARAATGGPSHGELEERRWGPGGREHFAGPRPGDFPGRGAPQPRHPEPEREAEATP